MPSPDFYEIVAEAARKTTDPDPDTEPGAEQIVSDAIGAPRGIKRRTGDHTYVIEETS
jgi:hypothetical protein